jgi:hypothetical protein
MQEVFYTFDNPHNAKPRFIRLLASLRGFLSA